MCVVWGPFLPWLGITRVDRKDMLAGELEINSRNTAKSLAANGIAQGPLCLLASAAYWLRYLFRVFLASIAILLLTTSEAYAYIDPGSGALIWQLLLAAFFGAMFFIRRVKLWIAATMSWIWAIITGSK